MNKGTFFNEKKFLSQLELSLSQIKDIQKLYHRFLYAINDHFSAEAACLFYNEAGGRELNRSIYKGDAGLFNTPFIKSFALKQKPELPNNLLLSTVKVHDRLVGIVGLKSSKDFQAGSGYKLRDCCIVLAKELTLRVEERQGRILDRLKEKVVGELRPIDLAYQILDGLRHLVYYDHSSTLLTFEKSDNSLGVLAEKVAWTKSKSAFVGHKITLPAEVAADLLVSPGIRLLGRKGNNNSPDNSFENILFRLLDYSRGDRIPSPTSMLCAPLIYRDELLGILKISSRKRPPFDERDVHIVECFLRIAATSLRNARLTDTLGERALQAEMRGSLVKAMSHDIRNAIGTILLLGPQVLHDLESECFDIQTLKEDMNAIIKDAQLIQRIFTNLLRESGPGRLGLGPVDVNIVVKEVTELLKTRLEHKHIKLELNFGSNLPAVYASRRHLEHIIFNLVTNAAEAITCAHGLITITTEFYPDINRLRLSVQDNGPGMSPELLTQAQEPFFSTKPGGTGLGLPLCRALAWQINALFSIASTPGKGTTVTLKLEVKP